MVVKAREKKKERDGFFFLRRKFRCLCFLSHVLRKKDTRTYKAKVLHTNTKRSRDDDDDDDDSKRIFHRTNKNAKERRVTKDLKQSRCSIGWW